MAFRRLVISLATLGLIAGSIGCSSKKGHNSNNTKVAVTKEKLKQMEADAEAAKKAEESAKKAEADFLAKLAALEPREAKVGEGLAAIAAFDEARTKNEALLAQLKASITENTALATTLAGEVSDLQGQSQAEAEKVESLKADLEKANQTILAANTTYADMIKNAIAQQQRLDDAMVVGEKLFSSLNRDAAFENLMKGDGQFNVQISVVGTTSETVARGIRNILSSINTKPGYVSNISPSEDTIKAFRSAKARAQVMGGNRLDLPGVETLNVVEASLAPLEGLNVRDRILLNAKGTDVLTAIQAANTFAKDNKANVLIVPQTVDKILLRYTINIELAEVVNGTPNTVRKFKVSPLVLKDIEVKGTEIGSVDLTQAAQQKVSNEMMKCSENIQVCLEGLKKTGLLDVEVDTQKIGFQEVGTLTPTNDKELSEWFENNRKSTPKKKLNEFIKDLIGLSGTQAKFEAYGDANQTPVEAPNAVGRTARAVTPYVARADGKYGMISSISVESQAIMPISSPNGYTPTFLLFDADSFKHVGVNPIVAVGSMIGSNYAKDIVTLGADPSTGLVVHGTKLSFGSNVIASHNLIDLSPAIVQGTTVKAAPVSTASHADPFSDMGGPLVANQNLRQEMIRYFVSLKALFETVK
jgi:hypothetical protein